MPSTPFSLVGLLALTHTWLSDLSYWADKKGSEANSGGVLGGGQGRVGISLSLSLLSTPMCHGGHLTRKECWLMFRFEGHLVTV